MKTSWGEDKETLCYHGENPKTKEWCLLKTYGGALVENVTQAVARDLMANAVLNVEAADYDVVLTVHDELIAEIGEGCECGTCHWCDVRGQPSEKEYHETMLDMFLKLMCDTPTWARGLPVAAEGWVGRRYRK
jgi:DNA polymerase